MPGADWALGRRFRRCRTVRLTSFGRSRGSPRSFEVRRSHGKNHAVVIAGWGLRRWNQRGLPDPGLGRQPDVTSQWKSTVSAPIA